MRRQWIVSTALVATLVAGLVPGVAGVATAKEYGIKRQSYIVKTRHGKIFVQVAHPTLGDKVVKGPAIFTYSPYSILGAPPNYRRNLGVNDWVPLGYHRVWADVVGTGNSGGCFDYGGKRERQSGYDLVEWIAKQKWSTGKVGMIGGSYEGTTATAAAVEDPPHLTTIVPEAAISRWYGYAYAGGIRYFWTNEPVGHQGPGSAADEGFDTPAAFDFGLAVPPPVDPNNPGWDERFEDNARLCDEVEHMNHGYDDTPDYDKFWRERDYVIRAHKVDIPVLIAHNWGDFNVKQDEAWNLFHALKNSPNKKLYMGSRWKGHDTPGGKYEAVVRAWMDHYLKGVDNGIEKLPTITSETSNADGTLKFLSANRVNVRNVTLIAQNTPKTRPDDYEWKLLPTKPQKSMRPAEARFVSAGINTEIHANHHARNNHDWFWFETPHLKRDTRIFGSPKVTIYSTVHRRWVTYTPTIVDVDPADHTVVQGNHVNKDPSSLVSVTRGWLDSRYRKSLAKQVPIKPGKPFSMTVVEKPQDYVFKKGHYIGLSIATEINEWSLPKPYQCSTADCPFVFINWKEGKTRLTLPIVNAPKNPMKLFDFAHHHH